MPSNLDIAQGFDASIPEAEKMVVAAARNVQTLAGEVGDAAVIKAYANLQFFVTQVDLDLRVNLRNLLSDRSSRITSEKYLALALIEADKGIGILLNKLRVEGAKQRGRLEGFLDLQLFQSARDAVEARMKPMREDTGFSTELRLIRNEVVAHFVSKDSGVENSAMWALSRAALPEDQDVVANSKIVEYAVAFAVGLRELSQGLTAATRVWMTANARR